MSEISNVGMRHEAEQAIKLEEIVQTLVSVGYYRARIKGLTSFDRIVGAMTWCIESCLFDVDVDFLFRENLNIGQRIALTERIVRMLPKMDCPHTLEPYQIQGLDYVHISPVIQWLVARSTKTRGEMAQYIRSFSDDQFHTKRILGLGRHQIYPLKLNAMTENIETIENHETSTHIRTIPHVWTEKNIKRVLEHRQYRESITESTEHSAAPVLQTISNRDSSLHGKSQRILSKRRRLRQTSSDFKVRLNKVHDIECALEQEMSKTDADTLGQDRRLFEELQEKIRISNELKTQEDKFRAQCASDLDLLNKMWVNLQLGKFEKIVDYAEDYGNRRELVEKLRLHLAKRLRWIATSTRQLDDIPGRSELTQYQKRFLELYNQVSIKHEETKQYYTLYNTLSTTELYLYKELSLLNSIQENYEQVMSSSTGRRQFTEQLDSIVVGVQNNKAKVEALYLEEKSRRDSLNHILSNLNEQQREYIVAVSTLTHECRYNESLLAQLRGLQ